MQFLTLPGNTSAVPYQKNECSLYSHTGECFIYKGWAVVTDGGDSYDAAVYDGIIDLYKAIENKTLVELGLTELDHYKTIDNVIGSWNRSMPYRYILADYNGNNGATNQPNSNGFSPVSIDYLVPSVSVEWLWRKIFEKYNNNIQPLGSVFNTPDFKQLYMTFPKGQVRTDTSDVPLFKSSDYHFIDSRSHWRERKIYYCKFITTQLYNAQELRHDSSVHLRVATPGSYKIKIKGKLFGQRDGNHDIHKDCFIRIGKNCNNIAASQVGNRIINIFTQEPYLIYNTEYEQTSNPFLLNASDSICVILGGQGVDSFSIAQNGPYDELTIELIKVDSESVDFSEALTDFSVKDFMNEVIQRFGLTLFKNKFSNVYTFLTLQEQLQNADTVNWTEKFSKKISENYAHGSYAQNNWFKYAYNDKESTHNDGAIQIANVNLPESRDVIKSKIYSPERIPSMFLGQESKVYKLWEKEAVENPEPGAPTVTYKQLDKRYYFLKAQLSWQYVNLISPLLGSFNNTATLTYKETFSGLSFKEIITNYYGPLQSVLNTAVIVTAELWLTDVDIANFDFKKLYYIEQLSSYFIINKINNYIPGRVTKCELVKVQYSLPVEVVIPQIYTIESITLSGTSRAELYFSNIFVNYDAYLEHSTDNVNWSFYRHIFSNEDSPYTTPSLASGSHYFRISCYVYHPVATTQYSTTVIIVIP